MHEQEQRTAYSGDQVVAAPCSKECPRLWNPVYGGSVALDFHVASQVLANLIQVRGGKVWEVEAQ